MSTNSKTPRIAVAQQLLECGLSSYFDGSYFAALHLAGAAEEIFGRYLQRLKTNTVLQSIKEDAAVMLAGSSFEIPDKAHLDMVGKWANMPRNAVKHIDLVGDDEIEFDPRSAAREMLERAISNLCRLMELSRRYRLAARSRRSLLQSDRFLPDDSTRVSPTCFAEGNGRK